MEIPPNNSKGEQDPDDPGDRDSPKADDNDKAEPQEDKGATPPTEGLEDFGSPNDEQKKPTDENEEMNGLGDFDPEDNEPMHIDDDDEEMKDAGDSATRHDPSEAAIDHDEEHDDLTTDQIIQAHQKKQKEDTIDNNPKGDSGQHEHGREKSNSIESHPDNDENVRTRTEDDIREELRLAKKHLKQLRRENQNLSEQSIAVVRLERELSLRQAAEQFELQNQLHDPEDDSLFVQQDHLGSSKRPLPDENYFPWENSAKRARLNDLEEEVLPILSDDAGDNDGDINEKKKKRRPVGKKIDPKRKPKSKKNNKGSESTGKEKRMSKRAQRIAELRNTGNLSGGTLFRDVRDNEGRTEQPTFKATGTKADAFKQLIASIPAEARQESTYDRTALFDASKKFGRGRCKAADDGQWLLKGMKSVLSHYQMLGAAFMVERERMGEDPKGGILADSMGLGKTVMSLATIVSNQPPIRDASDLNTTLIVTPASITLQWLEEIHKHVHCRASKKAGIGLVMKYSRATSHVNTDPVSYMASHDIVVTTYAEVLGSYPKATPPIQLQTAQEKEAWWRQHFFEKRGSLHQMHWRRVILDEATAIKNHKSWTAKACLQLRSDYRWIISGTPAMNSLCEFYSYFKFLRVPNVGSSKVFKKNFITDTSQGPERLQTFLRPFMLRRTHESTMFGAKLINLPEPTRHTLVVHFSELEKQIYEVVRRRFILMINNFARKGELRKKYSHILTLLLRLRQLASHPLLIQDSLRDLLQPEDFTELKRITEKPLLSHQEQQALIKHLRRMLKNPKELVQLDPGSPDVTLPDVEVAKEPVSTQGGHKDTRKERDSDLQPRGVEANIENSQTGGALSVGGSFGLKNDLGKFIQHFQDQQEGDRIEESIKCGKCDKKPQDPHMTSCQHTYCIDCLMLMSSEAEQAYMKCLVCGTSFNGTQVYETGDAARQKFPDYKPTTFSKDQTPSGVEKSTGTKGKKPSPKEVVEGWLDAKGHMVPSAKTIAVKSQILNWLAEKPTPKIIIYSQFRTILIILKKMCELEGWNCVEFHGAMKMEARAKAVKSLENDSNVHIMLASLKTGGVGLNLSCASRVLNVDLWWNSAVEEQAFCRTYRRGQKRETFLTRLAVQGTIDMDILKMQERKEREIDSVIAARPRNLTPRELLELFGPIGEGPDGTEFIYVDDMKEGGPETGIEDDDEEILM